MWPIYNLGEERDTVTTSSRTCYLKLNHLYTVRMAETRLHSWRNVRQESGHRSCTGMQGFSDEIISKHIRFGVVSLTQEPGQRSGCRVDSKGVGIRVPAGNVPSKLRARGWAADVIVPRNSIKTPAHFIGLAYSQFEAINIKSIKLNFTFELINLITVTDLFLKLLSLPWKMEGSTPDEVI